MVRIKALFVLLGVTALSAYTIGRYGAPATPPTVPAVAHAHQTTAKASAPKPRKAKAPAGSDR
jgi:hypothetical protein